MGIALYDHQLKAKEELRNGKVLKGDVGSGKSRAGLAYFYEEVCGGSLEDVSAPFRSPKDLYIITTAKKRNKLEWEEEALPFRISVDRDTSKQGVKLFVDSWNNIKNYVDVKDAFFIFDEQRAVGAGTWAKSFLKIAKSNEWIMLSATPGDQWMDYAPLFVANGFYKNRTEFVDQHAVYARYSRYPKIDRWHGTARLKKNRDRILVPMPAMRHTVRKDVPVVVSYGEALFRLAIEDRWHVYENRPIRDIAELCSVLRKIVNGDPCRLDAVMKIAETHPRLIIFYNFNYELEMLRKLEFFLDIEVKEYNGHKHDALPGGDRWIYLVQYTAGAEGWNCTTTDSIIFYSLNYSYRITEQAKGRIDRINTPFTDLYYYFLQSDSWIDKAILRTLANKKNFNKRDEQKLIDDFVKEVTDFVADQESIKDYTGEQELRSDPVRVG